VRKLRAVVQSFPVDSRHNGEAFLRVQVICKTGIRVETELLDELYKAVERYEGKKLAMMHIAQGNTWETLCYRRYQNGGVRNDVQPPKLSCSEMVHQRSNALLSVVNRAPWQIPSKRKKGKGKVKIEAKSIQSVFVPAKQGGLSIRTKTKKLKKKLKFWWCAVKKK